MEAELPPQYKKTRSPAAPSLPLQDCLQDIGHLYTNYGHNTFTKEEVASTLAFSAQSGPFRQRFASHKMFGLITHVGGELYAVSELTKKLLTSTRHSSEFKEGALEAIMHADAYRELLQQYTHTLPPVTGIAQTLEMKKRFNKKKARITAEVLHASLLHASLVDSKHNLLPTHNHHTENTDVPLPSALPDISTPTDKTERAAQEIIPILKAEIPVDAEHMVVVMYPKTLTKTQAQKISRVLDAITD